MPNCREPCTNAKAHGWPPVGVVFVKRLQLLASSSGAHIGLRDRASKRLIICSWFDQQLEPASRCDTTDGRLFNFCSLATLLIGARTPHELVLEMRLDEAMDPQVENTIPVLPAKCLKRSRDFYVETLGFKVDWGDADDALVCQVSRDGRPIMLKEDPRLGSPACVWIGLESDQLFAEFIAKGVSVLEGPQNQPWAYEMLIEDIDGNILWLGTEPKS